MRRRLIPVLAGGQLPAPGRIDGLQLGGAEAGDAVLLLLAQPGLLGVAEHAAGEEVDELADDDEDEGDGVEEVDGEAEDADADDGAPEVAGEQGDVEEGGGGDAQDEGHDGVEERERDRVAHDVPDDGTVEVGRLEAVAVEDGGLHAVDEEAEEAEEGKDLVRRPLANEPLLEGVGQAVERGAEEGEQVTLEQVGARPAVRALDVVAREQDAGAADADEDANDLEDLVAHAQQEERDDDDDDDGPEVDELRRQDVGVVVRQHDEVVALDVEEGEDEVLPPVVPEDAPELLEPVLVQHVGEVDERQQHVVEEGLEGGDRGVARHQQRRERVGRRDGERQHLADDEHDPEVPRGEVRVPAHLFALELTQPLAHGLAVGGVSGIAAGGRRDAAVVVVDAIVVRRDGPDFHYVAQRVGLGVRLLSRGRVVGRHFNLLDRNVAST